ncbi:MAG: acyl-CoA thioesterase [Lachnospiraceae bacterium]|nr:acyl-CoA thioesterase [Lachnospiraceae bacterium]
MKQYETLHLVAGEDLNHHGTLFAARAAGWFVEAAFTAAACAYGKNEIVCRNLHGMSFKKPVQPGTVLKFLARVVYTGKSSFMVDVSAVDALSGEEAIEGMVTFVTVDGKTGKKTEHHITLDEPENEKEKERRGAAEKLWKSFDKCGRLVSY